MWKSQAEDNGMRKSGVRRDAIQTAEETGCVENEAISH